MDRSRRPSTLGRVLIILLAALMVLGAVVLLGGGIQLIALGGSWYFAIAGAALLVAGVLTGLLYVSGAWLFLLILLGSAVWALWEVGLEFWPLVSRLFAPGVLAVMVLFAAPYLYKGRALFSRPAGFGLAGLTFVALAATTAWAMFPHPIVASTEPVQAAAVVQDEAVDWRHYGRSQAGTRYAPAAQITPENVDQLEVAWTFRTGDVPALATSGAEDQNTPTQVGDALYVCTVHNIVYALDAETGEQRWKFDPQANSPFWQRCRGVGYYEAGTAPATAATPAQAPAGDPAPAPNAAPAAPVTQSPAAEAAPAATAQAAICARRIVLSTIDARLIQLDTETGEPCPQFGEGGTVDLKVGMGEVRPGFYFQTSAPTVASGLIIIGGWVVDNVAVGLPSGVVRAFSAETGDLVWAWDLGNPQITKLPPDGESYTRGTPNVWSTPAVDEDLGLVYLPTGNATPDFFGGHRSEAAEEYSSSIVAVDLVTGRERWKFQTVHHDLWDYDVPSQPALFDIPDGNGGTVQAVIQTTKRGQTFVLDRRTGEPITAVEERPVPQGAVEGDWTAPTQPYSVGFPAIGAEPLSEKRMWGATPFDQLYWRIRFLSARYEGDFTPPGLAPSIEWPGFFGGMNWGSVSVHEPSGYLIMNDTRSPHWVELVPREQADAEEAAASHEGLSRQLGTPYGASKVTFMSPLGIPCQEPPYGTLTAVNMETKQIAWQVPLGTTADTGPLGIAMRLPIPVGMPTVGGPVSTASGLIFYAGTLDHNIRAFDLGSGKEVWRDRLPVGSQATPMTYVSPRSRRQFVVVSAGGARQSTERGDYVIAYSLPTAP
jgi:quinate dehydrogenase (quinone)